MRSIAYERPIIHCVLLICYYILIGFALYDEPMSFGHALTLLYYGRSSLYSVTCTLYDGKVTLYDDNLS